MVFIQFICVFITPVLTPAPHPHPMAAAATSLGFVLMFISALPLAPVLCIAVIYSDVKVCLCVAPCYTHEYSCTPVFLIVTATPPCTQASQHTLITLTNHVTIFTTYYFVIVTTITLQVLRMTLLKSRRPMRIDAEDIGVVQSMLEFVAAASVTTNAGLFIFTQPLPYDYSLGTRLWIFIIFHIVCINVRQLAQYVIVDDPVVSEVSKKRQAFFESKLVDQTPDVETENDDVVLAADETHSDGLKGEVQMQKYPEDPLLFPLTRDHTDFIH